MSACTNDFRDCRVTILMATYNGSDYILDQVRSLQNQNHKNWILRVRDDCSSDATLNILKNLMLYDHRISILSDDDGRLGARGNFARLMSESLDSDYVMFCDQDDIWLPHKIEESISAMKALDAEYGSDQCLLVYGTYRLIDQQSVLIKVNSPDYSAPPSLNLLLTQNFLYGCTMTINKALLKRSLPVPVTAENHDY